MKCTETTHVIDFEIGSCECGQVQPTDLADFGAGITPLALHDEIFIFSEDDLDG